MAPAAPQPPPPTARARAAAARRDQIFETALELFATSGYRGTTIAAVAERVGITDAGVLYHVKTKEELLLRALEHFDRQVESDLADADLHGVELLRIVREWGAGMEQAPAVSSLLIVLSAEHLTEDSPARRYIQRRYRLLLDRYTAAFAEAAAAGDLRADLDAAGEASALIAHLDGARLQWFLLDRTTSLADSVRAYVDATLERLDPR